MAVRKIRANYGSVTGLVADDQASRSTAYESSLERDFIKHLIFNKNVLKHEEQPLTIEFTDSDGKQWRYIPDLSLQTTLRCGWVQLPRNGVIYSHLFFSGLHQMMGRLIYGRMAEPLKAALRKVTGSIYRSSTCQVRSFFLSASKSFSAAL